jgi:hypothetical protein
MMSAVLNELAADAYGANQFAFRGRQNFLCETRFQEQRANTELMLVFPSPRASAAPTSHSGHKRDARRLTSWQVA